MPLKQGNNSVIRLYKLEQGTQTEVTELKTTQNQVIHKRVTITFNANGGSGGSTQVRTWGVEQIVTPPTPTRSGRWLFNGWYTTPQGSNKLTFPMETPQYNKTYYAQWRVQTETGSLKWVYKGASSTNICFCQGINMIGSPCSTAGETMTTCGADAESSDTCSVLECMWQ